LTTKTSAPTRTTNTSNLKIRPTTMLTRLTISEPKTTSAMIGSPIHFTHHGRLFSNFCMTVQHS